MKPADLKLVERAMSSDWKTVPIDYFGTHTGASYLIGPEKYRLGYRDCDAVGIVAIRNLAPHLIKLWEACETEIQATCPTEPVTAESEEEECDSTFHVRSCPKGKARDERFKVLSRLRNL